MMRAYLKQPLVIATLIACLCGLLTLAQPIDQIYWNMRFLFGQKSAPQSIVLVKLSSLGGGVTPADLDRESVAVLDTLRKQAPAHVYLDRKLVDPSPQLRATISAYGDKLSVVARIAGAETLAPRKEDLPGNDIVDAKRVVVSGWLTNFWGYAVAAPYEIMIDGHTYRSVSASIVGELGSPRNTFRPDFTVNPSSVRILSASQLRSQTIDARMFADRNVIVSAGRADQIGYFGHGRIDPVYLDIAGVEGLNTGALFNIEWLPFLALFFALTWFSERLKGKKLKRLILICNALIVMFGPIIVERAGAFSIPSPSLVCLLVFVSLKSWAKWRQRVQQTGRSGLPNFVALVEGQIPSEHDVIVAVIGRYEEFLATLPPSLHGECARQIARRFAVGSGSAEIFHGDGGYFAWIEPTKPADQQYEHLDGLRALFSAPLLVGGHTFDTNVHFGLERNFELDPLTRINTALASATEALKHGRTVEQFAANRLANAAWELSLLARIDEGMKNGDIWLAYQPQWDYQEARISGAEALIRWNDPVRGPIRPDEFILQAEQAGRIDALTYWVMDHAITAAEKFNVLGSPFQVSVNLSAQLVDKPSLVSSVSEIVRRRGIDPRLLTIEVTETAGVGNRPDAIRNLSQLRAMGFRLSIDDFGTGEASLTYLADLPSDELKLDRRFVSQVTHRERERHIVASTINLAHALGQVVVAEGIEDISTFELLRQLGCDVGQGYYIGRPETFEQLFARYAALSQRHGTG